METKGLEDVDLVLDSVAQISEDDLNSLKALLILFGKPHMLGVEIGSWCGQSTCVIGFWVQKFSGKLVAIDTFKGEGSDLSSWLDKMDPKECLLTNLANCNLQDTVTVVENTSMSQVHNFKDGEVDFIFLDGDHRYDSISKDISEWYKKVKVGGIMCGHDFNSLGYINDFINEDCVGGIHHGVSKAVTEFFPSFNKAPDCIWWVMKGAS